MSYAIEPFGNRHQLVLVEPDGTRTPLLPSYATHEEAASEQSARARRDQALTARYLIWSWEHRAWWGPNGCGYTTDLRLAGRYTEAKAAAATVGHIPPGEEVAVLEQWAVKRGAPPVYAAEVTR